MENEIKDEELDAMRAAAEAEGEEVTIVELYDEDGNSMQFMEDMVIPYDGKQFSLLVKLDNDGDDDCCCGEHEHEHEHEHGDGCCCGDDEDNCILARIDFDAKGEPVYVAPTDEEFKAVSALYNEMYADEEEE